jgi:hypothetical protein
LSGSRRELFDAVLKVARSAETERNHLAHGCFGVSAELPDALLWVETKHFGPWNVAEVRKDTVTTQDDFKKLAQHIFYYNTNDLKEILEQISDTFNVLSQYSDYIRYPAPPNSPTDEARYRRLCSLPRVSAALNLMRSAT